MEEEKDKKFRALIKLLLWLIFIVFVILVINFSKQLRRGECFMKIKLGIVNFLTLIRLIGTIILIPLYNMFGGKVVGITSFFCYLTDSIDGILARRWKVSTFFGAIFDGVADKLFTITNFIILYLITPYALIPIII